MGHMGYQGSSDAQIVSHWRSSIYMRCVVLYSYISLHSSVGGDWVTTAYISPKLQLLLALLKLTAENVIV